MQKNLQELKNRLLETYDLKMIESILFWDQSTYMPPGGSTARSRQRSTLARITQEKLTSPAIGKLLEDLLSYEENLPYDSDEASLIRVARREYERYLKIPPEFMERFYKHRGETYQVWTKARATDDFSLVQSHLEKTLDLSREMANYFPGYEHIADPLIDYHDFGLRASTIKALFTELREKLLPILEEITSQPLADDSCLHQNFPEEQQLAFGHQVIKDLGYDFNRGREDKTHHPFTTKFSLGDVRITTRVKEDFLGESLFSTIHEAGHGMYEQGINMDYEGTPLAQGASSSMHESQSRLWENIVCRSRGFWEGYYPKLQAVFPNQLRTVSLDAFYKAINKVIPSLIRTDADEVTYNLHVMIRFDFELALLEGKLSVKELPEAWRDRYQSDLGVTPPDDRDGVLQDVHWFDYVIGGAFQGYTMGNILGAQFFQAALKDHPEIPDEIRQGKFDTLLNWLKENIYQHGRKFTTTELVERVTGGPISVDPYIHYLRHKYETLYNL